jgi:hypothetical protein
MSVPRTTRATLLAAISHAETPSKMIQTAANRLMMPSRFNYFLHHIMIEVVEELEYEPVMHST